MIPGRPLRFLVLVAGGWVAARGVMLWPGVPPLAAVGSAMVPHADAQGSKESAAPLALPGVATAVVWHRQPMAPVTHGTPAFLGPFLEQEHQPAIQPLGQTTPISSNAPDTGIIAGLPVRVPTVKAQAGHTPSRFFGSAWLFVRPGNGTAAGLSGPQLGGSQAGVRLGYALTANRRLALAARASSPLGKGMREVAFGVEWQPTRLPVRVIAEQRIAVGAGRGGPTLGIVGGAGPLPVAGGFRLETYAQGGIIGRDGGEGFADGAARIARPAASLGDIRIDLGGGLWGAAQKGAARVDIGPSLSARVPLGGQPVRVSLDWRQRVAGNATPGSGLVLTLGADF
jgi:hypothetical protein